MARNKKTKVEYQRKINLLLKCDMYKADNKKLPISEKEYQDLKDEILILESRYPSIKKIAENSVIRAEQRYPDGRIYKGAIKSAEQQIPHGDGFMCLNRHDSDPESKKFGTKLTDNPWVYTGEFKNGVFDGQGEYISKGNYSYKGEWKKSHFNGKGKFVDEKENDIYEGEFVNDERHGYGVSVTANQSKYEGQWKDNVPNGKGKITYLKDFEENEKGTVWKGIFKDGQMHGKFEITFSDGDIIDSVFVNGVRTIAEYRDERKILLKNIKYLDADFLEKASDHLKKDKKFILKAVKINGLALEYADDSLKKDKEVVLAAMKENPRAMMDADDSLMTDKELVLMGFNCDVELLDFAADSLKKDRKFILQLVKKDGFALVYTNNSLKKDKEVVIAAIKENDKALQFAHKSLWKDPDILAILNKKKK